MLLLEGQPKQGIAMLCCTILRALSAALLDSNKGGTFQPPIILSVCLSFSGGFGLDASHRLSRHPGTIHE